MQSDGNHQELVEIKREIIDSRNQNIKTDNQVKNMALDIKSFEQRFSVLEKRTRIAALGVHLIVAMVVGVAAIIVITTQSATYNKQIAALEGQLAESTDSLRSELSVYKKKQAQGEQVRLTRQREREILLRWLTLVADKEDDAAADLVVSLDLSLLSSLEQKLLAPTLADLRRRVGETAFRTGRTHLLAKRLVEAEDAFARSLKIDDTGAFAEKARQYQAIILYDLRQYEQAIPLLKLARAATTDKRAGGDIDFRLGTALARLGKREDALRVLHSILPPSRYAAAAAAYIKALEQGNDLPPEANKKRRMDIGQSGASTSSHLNTNTVKTP